jgi:hypothetical protein
VTDPKKFDSSEQLRHRHIEFFDRTLLKRPAARAGLGKLQLTAVSSITG